MNIKTTEYFWDCECKDDYIHPKQQVYCGACATSQGGQPDSRKDEVEEMLKGLPAEALAQEGETI